MFEWRHRHIDRSLNVPDTSLSEQVWPEGRGGSRGLAFLFADTDPCLSPRLAPRVEAIRTRGGVPARSVCRRSRSRVDADICPDPADGARVAAHRHHADPVAEDHYQGQRLDRY